MKILIATDGSEFSRKALDKACEVAKGREGVSFLVISVYEPQVPMAAEPYALSAQYFERLDGLARERAEETARAGVNFLRSKFPNASVEIESVVKFGGPAQMIVEAADAWDADLIVVGSHGHGFWGRLALGSVSDAVLHHAPCSVLVVRGSGAPTAGTWDKEVKPAVEPPPA
jgi:nucleotide-binding universal stress UspA family protein